MLNIGWFSTGRDEAARQLLQVVQNTIKHGQINGKILFVLSNREKGAGRETDLFFDLVNSYNIPLICFSYHKFIDLKKVKVNKESGGLPSWRIEYDREVMRRLNAYSPDICVLAGYMLIVGEEMCNKYKMINLHPAEPGGPTGSWQEVIWKLIENRAQKSGVIMHLVTPELDRGPVVTYCTYSIKGKPFDNYWNEIDKYPLGKIKDEQGENNVLFRLIRQEGLKREFPLIVSTLKSFSQSNIRIENGKITDSKGQPVTGYDLTEEIEKTLRKEKV